MSEIEAEGSVLTGTPEAESGGWTDNFADAATKEHITSKGYENPEALAAAYINLEKAVGADKIVMPAEGTDVAEWDGWEKLGLPSDASGYELAAPEGFDQYDQGLSDWFKEAAHAAKMPASQAQRLHDAFVERMMGSYSEQVTNAQQQQAANEADLKKEYGAAFDERVAAARSALREFGSPEMVKKLDATGLGSDPDFVRAFAKIGVSLGKGSQFKDGNEASGSFGTTPEMAKEQIAAIRNNPGLMDKAHPEHKVLNEKLTRLNEMAHGTDPV